MDQFNKITFWCEFPEEVDWKKVNELIDFQTSVYIASNSRREFLKWKSKIKSKYISVGVWPTLSKEKGYWFSSYCSKESIDKLKEFRGINLKIDLEPPIIQGGYGFIRIITIYTKLLLFKKPKNGFYLNKIIAELSKESEIILSGLPLPKNLAKRYGDNYTENNVFRNSFIYSTLTPRILRPIMNIYYKYYIKRSIKNHKDKLMFAVGCIGHGIFYNEPTYNNIKEFEKDLKFLLKNKVKNVVIFDLTGIMKKQNTEEWLKIIKENTKFY